MNAPKKKKKKKNERSVSFCQLAQKREKRKKHWRGYREKKVVNKKKDAVFGLGSRKEEKRKEKLKRKCRGPVVEGASVDGLLCSLGVVARVDCAFDMAVELAGETFARGRISV